MNSLTREQKLLGAAGANVLFIISLFFPWYGFAGTNIDGTDVIPSWWIMLIFAAVSAAILAAEAFNYELPAAIDPATWAAYLTSVTFIVTLMIFLEGSAGGRKIGLFLALIFSAIATVLTVIHWREEGK